MKQLIGLTFAKLLNFGFYYHYFFFLELVTTSENPGLAVERNSTQGLTKHCTSSDLWVLTCLCRPARNILFVYVSVKQV